MRPTIYLGKTSKTSKTSPTSPPSPTRPTIKLPRPTTITMRCCGRKMRGVDGTAWSCCGTSYVLLGTV